MITPSNYLTASPALYFDRDSCRESYFGIASTAILTRRPGGGFSVFEARFSNRIFRELKRIAREGETVAGLICDRRGALDRSSIRALNVYLRNVRVRGVTKYDWSGFCEDLAFRWSR